jgi:hypothetical protein
LGHISGDFSQTILVTLLFTFKELSEFFTGLLATVKVTLYTLPYYHLPLPKKFAQAALHT